MGAVRLRRQPRQNATPMAVIGAWIPEARVRQLDELANAEGLARSYFLARVIEEYLAKHVDREGSGALG